MDGMFSTRDAVEAPDRTSRGDYSRGSRSRRFVVGRWKPSSHVATVN